MEGFVVSVVSWETHREELLEVRTEVFVIEQKVPASIEVDEYDPLSVHFLAVDRETEQPIGTARLLPAGKIGRVAVLKPWRMKGVGLELMKAAVDHARSRGDNEIVLHAQSWTTAFYEKLGFEVFGDEFEEAGIAHRSMKLIL